MDTTREKGMNLQGGELQVELIKIVAEQNQERFMDYDCVTNVATMYVVKNGRFVVHSIWENYYSDGGFECDLIAEEDRELYQKEMLSCLKRPSHRVFDVRYLNQKREKIWYRTCLVSVVDENQKVCKLAGRFISVHKEKEANELIRRQAERDSLTGVYNHVTYEALCRELLYRHKGDALFLMMDIDNFKQINDNFGHQVGDSIVAQVGQVLQETVENIGVAGRIGGDEFSVCVHHIESMDAARALCARIREGLVCSPEGVKFEVSIGGTRSLGRECSYEDLYYEADEALYYAKEHGKNRIIFADELDELKEKACLARMEEYPLSDMEQELDELMLYCFVTDPKTRKILYMNKSARKRLGLSSDEVKQMSCMELIKGCTSECEFCDLHATHTHLYEGDAAAGLQKYIPGGRFLIYSRYAMWQGQPARLIKFLDIQDGKHLERCYIDEMQAQETLSDCWDLIHESATQEVEYDKVLSVLNNYYNADCCTIIAKEGTKYTDLYEYHRAAAEHIVEGVKKTLEDQFFSSLEVLIDQDGFMRPHHIDRVLQRYPELKEYLEQNQVHKTIGIRLLRRNVFVGVLLVINPREHIYDYLVLKRIAVFFSTDLLRKKLLENKEYELTHDKMTRLWNRAFFGEWQAKYGSLITANFGIYTVDILNFSAINKELGYENGNIMLLEIADVFRNVFAGYSVFRYDDDQLMAICTEVDRKSCEKLFDYAKEQIDELDIEVCTGYAWVEDGELADSIREANAMLEKERVQKKNNHSESGKLYKHIKQGVLDEMEKGNFQVFLQPKVSLLTGETIGAEALIRLWDDVRGYVAPAFFVPILEERGVISMIDLFVLKEVFCFQREAIDKGYRVVPISVNFSKNTLMHKNLMEQISEMYDEYAIPQGLIEIEITETISSMDQLLVKKIAHNLKTMGFSISMDDFGTQYSNMAVLTQFDFDTVKVDRSLLLDIEKDKEKYTILKYTLGMLKELGVNRIIEGVETLEQAEALKDLGCDMVQGYLYGRPEPMEQFYTHFMNKN